MTNKQRRTEEVFDIIEALISQGAASIRPGDVATAMRERNAPLGTWQIRAEFTLLEELGRIRCDLDTGAWQLADVPSLKDAG